MVPEEAHILSWYCYDDWFIKTKSDHCRLSYSRVKCQKSIEMSPNMKNRPVVLYKQAKVALDSWSLLQNWSMDFVSSKAG